MCHNEQKLINKDKLIEKVESSNPYENVNLMVTGLSESAIVEGGKYLGYKRAIDGVIELIKNTQ